MIAGFMTLLAYFYVDADSSEILLETDQSKKHGSVRKILIRRLRREYSPAITHPLSYLYLCSTYGRTKSEFRHSH